MHVLIAPDCFTGTLTAPQAAAAIADGWRRHRAARPAHLRAALGRRTRLRRRARRRPRRRRCTPSSRPTRSAGTCRHDPADDRRGRRRTAYVESAQAAGLHLLAADERDPTPHDARSGVGRLVLAALDPGPPAHRRGARRLGHQRRAAPACSPPSAPGPAAATRTRRARPRGRYARRRRRARRRPRPAAGRRPRHRQRRRLAAARSQGRERRLRRAEGRHAGAGAGARERAGSLRRASSSRVRPPARDLLTGTLLKPEREPGAGAAGGLGYALHLLGGRRVSGVEAVLERGRLRRPRSPPPTSSSPARAPSTGSRCSGKVVVGVAAAAAARSACPPSPCPASRSSGDARP